MRWSEREATVEVMRCSAALRTSTTAKEEAGKCKWEHGASRADAREGEGALWLNVAWLVRATAMRGLHRLHAAFAFWRRSATEA